MKRQTSYILIAIAAMLVPAALAITTFPTAMGDISENFARGRWFSLATPEHPPLQVWLTGLTGLVFPPSALSAILVGQALNAIGVVYLFLTLALVMDRARAMLFAFLLATSIYFMAAPLSYALNADIIQIPIWAAVAYHLLRATDTRRWLHWFAFAVWMAAAVYAKYSAAILIVGLGVASVVVPQYRVQWRNPRFYIACLITVLLCTPHFIALSADPAALTNAEIRVGRAAGLGARFGSLLGFIEGPLIFLAPGWIMVVLGLIRRDFLLTRPMIASAPAIRFLRWTFLGACGFVLVLIFGAGVSYLPRFDAPLFVLLILAVAPLVDLDRQRWYVVERRVKFTAASVAAVVFVAAVMAYTWFTAHSNMQEPLSDARAIMRAEWNHSYACGPAYYIGDRRTADGMSITGDRKPYGLPIDDIGVVRWFDPELLKKEGAILAFSGETFPADTVAAALPGVAYTEPKSFGLLLLRTLTGGSVGYSYAFIAPQDCPAPAAGGQG